MHKTGSLITAAAMAVCTSAALAQKDGGPQSTPRQPMHFCEMLSIADKFAGEVPHIKNPIIQQMAEIGVDAMREDAGRRYGETLSNEERAALVAKGNLKAALTEGAKAKCASAEIG